jgi:hypothetical protein
MLEFAADTREIPRPAGENAGLRDDGVELGSGAELRDDAFEKIPHPTDLL